MFAVSVGAVRLLNWPRILRGDHVRGRQVWLCRRDVTRERWHVHGLCGRLLFGFGRPDFVHGLRRRPLSGFGGSVLLRGLHIRDVLPRQRHGLLDLPCRLIFL